MRPYPQHATWSEAPNLQLFVITSIIIWCMMDKKLVPKCLGTCFVGHVGTSHVEKDHFITALPQREFPGVLDYAG
ncbi:hypothetical protein LY78DRAFT_288262 [Colletotrichum sublineola]|nr:hypothetical protein LY78DRAFT_288262 [Colletotrichum sublineola]